MATNNTLTYQDNPEAFKKEFERLMSLATNPKKASEFAQALTSTGEEMLKFVAASLNGDRPENRFAIDDEDKKKADEEEKKRKEAEEAAQRKIKETQDRADRLAKEAKDAEIKKAIEMARIEADKYIADRKYANGELKAQAYQDVLSMFLSKANVNVNLSVDQPANNQNSGKQQEQPAQNPQQPEQQPQQNNQPQQKPNVDVNNPEEAAKLKAEIEKQKQAENSSEEFCYFKSNELFG